MEEKEFEKLAELVVRHKEVATMIINGVPAQTQTIPVCLVVCPVCGEVIYEFQAGIPAVEANKALLDTQAQEALSHIAHYCPKCGQKLTYKREIIN